MSPTTSMLFVGLSPPREGCVWEQFSFRVSSALPHSKVAMSFHKVPDSDHSTLSFSMSSSTAPSPRRRDRRSRCSPSLVHSNSLKVNELVHLTATEQKCMSRRIPFELLYVSSVKIILKCLYLARIGRPDILWSVNKLARSITKWTKPVTNV